MITTNTMGGTAAAHMAGQISEKPKSFTAAAAISNCALLTFANEALIKNVSLLTKVESDNMKRTQFPKTFCSDIRIRLRNPQCGYIFAALILQTGTLCTIKWGYIFANGHN